MEGARVKTFLSSVRPDTSFCQGDLKWIEAYTGLEFVRTVTDLGSSLGMSSVGSTALAHDLFRCLWILETGYMSL